MADTSTTKKILTLDVFAKNEQWIYEYINVKDALSIKSITLSPDKRSLYCWRQTNPTASDLPAYIVEIPEPNLDGVMKKISGATVGNIPTFDENGGLEDSGVNTSNLVKYADMDKAIAERIKQVNHMKKEIVTALPEASAADRNTFYLLKVDGIKGKDSYEIYTVIGDELVLIDDTSVDMTGYLTTDQLEAAMETLRQSIIDQAVAQAALDSKAKADKALDDAKAYTDSQLTPINNSITTMTNDLTEVKGNITTINNTLVSHGDRITTVEGKVNDMQVATESEALEIFNSIFK